jgi:DNA polymerase-4
VATRLNYSDKLGKTVTLKVKFDDFTQITRSISLEHSINKQDEIRINVYNLLKNINIDKQIRLLGVTLSNLTEKKEECTNITIFEYIEKIN